MGNLNCKGENENKLTDELIMNNKVPKYIKFRGQWKTKQNFDGKLSKEECRMLVRGIKDECAGDKKKMAKEGLFGAQRWMEKASRREQNMEVMFIKRLR